MHKIAPAMGQLTGSEATSGRPGRGLLNVGTVRTPSSAPLPLRCFLRCRITGKERAGVAGLRLCRRMGKERAGGAPPPWLPATAPTALWGRRSERGGAVFHGRVGDGGGVGGDRSGGSCRREGPRR
jgi:hypothetical protein